MAVLAGIVCFILGSLCGVVTMALVAMASKEERKREEDEKKLRDK